jgi:hypothetical protein
MMRALLVFALALTAGPALAKPVRHATQPPRRPQATPVAERAASDRSRKSPAGADAPASARAGSGADANAGGETSAAVPPAPAPSGTAGGGAKVKTKTYTFGAMDVEGKLKTPQLLYFLNRVKLELDMSAPDKRSFMKELAKSADDKSL